MTILRKVRDKHVQEIIKKSAFSFSLKVIGVGLAFLLQIIISRKLGASGAGLYFLVVSFVIMLATIARMGMDHAVTRYVAAHSTSAEWAEVGSVVSNALRYSLAVSILISLLLYISADIVSIHIFDKPELKELFQLSCLAILPLSLYTIYARAVQGMKQAINSMLMLSVLPVLVTLVFTLLLYTSYGVAGCIFAYVLGAALTMLYGLVAWYKSAVHKKADFTGMPASTLLRTSYPLLGSELLQQVTINAPFFILGAYALSSEVGVFAAAQRTAGVVSLVLISANIILAPKFSELYRRGDMAALENVAQKGAILISLMAAPALIVIFLFPEWLMGLFGEDFGTGVSALLVITAGQMVNVITGAVGFLLIATGNERSYFTGNMLAAGLCVTLIPEYGAYGAALSFAVPLALVNLMRVHFVWKTLRILPLPIPYMPRHGG